MAGPGCWWECQGIQTPRAEKQPEKQNPGNPPGVHNLHPLSGSQNKDLQNIPATQPTVTTPTPGRPAKELQQKRTTEQHPPPPHPFSLLGPLQDFKTCKPPQPTRLHPSRTNFKQELQVPQPPLPPTCFPPTELQKNYKYCKPPRPTRLRPSRSNFKKELQVLQPPLPNPDSIPPTSNLQKIGKRSAPPPSLFHDLRIARRL